MQTINKCKKSITLKSLAYLMPLAALLERIEPFNNAMAFPDCKQTESALTANVVNFMPAICHHKGKKCQILLARFFLIRIALTSFSNCCSSKCSSCSRAIGLGWGVNHWNISRRKVEVCFRSTTTTTTTTIAWSQILMESNAMVVSI